ncbi:hypothetical protein QTP86_025326, partial [Hemibagrus guttatus]
SSTAHHQEDTDSGTFVLFLRPCSVMKLLLSVVVLFLALNEVFAEEIGPNEDQDYWANGSLMQDDWLQADPFRVLLRRITRKPRPHQFIGLMGKRSSGKIISLNSKEPSLALASSHFIE